VRLGLDSKSNRITVRRSAENCKLHNQDFDGIPGIEVFKAHWTISRQKVEYFVPADPSRIYDIVRYPVLVFVSKTCVSL